MEGREAASGEQEITSPDVRSFGFRAPRHRVLRETGGSFRGRTQGAGKGRQGASGSPGRKGAGKRAKREAAAPSVTGNEIAKEECGGGVKEEREREIWICHCSEYTRYLVFI